jgi:hypothetical protein
MKPDIYRDRRQRAFSLLEVMIATGIFFMGAFAVLSLVTNSLENARRLSRPDVDAGPVAGFLLMTNSFIEGSYDVDLGDFLGDAYKNYRVEYNVVEVETNHFYQVDFTVHSPDHGQPVVSKMTVDYFKPMSPPGSMDGGIGMTGR